MKTWIVTNERCEAVVAAILAFLVFFVGTSATPLIGQDEARFAQAAREMSHAGELVVPTFGGQPRYDKPILIYWLTMAGYTVFGVSERIARLPSNLAAALVIGLLAWWARRRWGPTSDSATGSFWPASSRSGSTPWPRGGGTARTPRSCCTWDSGRA